MGCQQLRADTAETIEDLLDELRYLDAFSAVAHLWEQPDTLATLTAEDMVLAARLACRLGGQRQSRAILRFARMRFPDDPAVRLSAQGLTMSSLYDALWEFSQTPRLPNASAEIAATWIGRHADSWAQARDFAKAKALLLEAESLAPDEPGLALFRASLAYHQRHYPKAFQLAQEAFRCNAGSPNAARLLAKTSFPAFREAEAFETLLEHAERMNQSYELAELAIAMGLTVVEDATAATAGTPFRLERERFLARMKTLLGDLRRRAPLACKETLRGFDMLAARFAIVCGAPSAAAEALGEKRDSYLERVIVNMLENPAGERTILRHTRERQQGDTCLPTSIAICLSALGAVIDTNQVAHQVTFQGTSILEISRWAKENGYLFHAFRGERTLCRELLRRGVAFVLCNTDVTFAHARAVVGIDERRGTYVVQDPNANMLLDLLFEGAETRDAPMGPKCCIVLPADRASLVADLNFVDERALLALDEGEEIRNTQGTAAFAEWLNRVKDEIRNPVALRYLDMLLHRDKGELAEARAILDELQREHPACALYERSRLDLVCQSGNENEHRRLLAQLANTTHPPESDHGVGSGNAALAFSLAEKLRADRTQHRRAHLHLRMGLRELWGDASAFHTLGKLYDADGELARAELALTLANLLQPEHEGYAHELAELRRRMTGSQTDVMSWLRQRTNMLTSVRGGVYPWITLVQTLAGWERLDEAIGTLDAALRLHAEQETLLRFAVEFFLPLGAWDRVQDLLSRLERGKDRHAELWARAETHEVLGRPDDALACWSDLVEHFPRDTDARQRLLSAVESSTGQDAAIALVSRWIEEEPGCLSYHHMREALKDGYEIPDDKILAVRERLQLNDLDHRVWLDLGWALTEALKDQDMQAREGLLRELEGVVGRAHALSPEPAWASTLEGEYWNLRNDPARAKAAFLLALRHRPDLAYPLQQLLTANESDLDAVAPEIFSALDEGMKNLAAPLQDMRSPVMMLAATLGADKTRAWVAAWATRMPLSVSLWEAYLCLHASQESLAAMLEEFEPVAREAASRLWHAHGVQVEFAAILTRLGRTAECEEHLQKCLERFPGNEALAWAYLERSENVRASGRWSEFLEGLRACWPGRHGLHALHASVLEKSGAPEGALAICRVMVEKFPSNLLYAEHLIRLAFVRGEPDVAGDFAESLVARFPEGSPAHLLAARAFAHLRAPEGAARARHLLTAVLRRNPNLADAIEEYSELESQHGNVAQAIDFLRGLSTRCAASFVRDLAILRLRAAEGEDVEEEIAEFGSRYSHRTEALELLLEWTEKSRNPSQWCELLAARMSDFLGIPHLAARLLTLLRERGVPFSHLETRWNELLEKAAGVKLVVLRYVDELIEVGRHTEAQRLLAQAWRRGWATGDRALREVEIGIAQERDVCVEFADFLFRSTSAPEQMGYLFQRAKQRPSLLAKLLNGLLTAARQDKLPSVRFLLPLLIVTSKTKFARRARALAKELGRHGACVRYGGDYMEVLPYVCETRWGASLCLQLGKRHADVLASDAHGWFGLLRSLLRKRRWAEAGRWCDGWESRANLELPELINVCIAQHKAKNHHEAARAAGRVLTEYSAADCKDSFEEVWSILIKSSIKTNRLEVLETLCLRLADKLAATGQLESMEQFGQLCLVAMQTKDLTPPVVEEIRVAFKSLKLPLHSELLLEAMSRGRSRWQQFGIEADFNKTSIIWDIGLLLVLLAWHLLFRK